MNADTGVGADSAAKGLNGYIWDGEVVEFAGWGWKDGNGDGDFEVGGRLGESWDADCWGEVEGWGCCVEGVEELVVEGEAAGVGELSGLRGEAWC